MVRTIVLIVACVWLFHLPGAQTPFVDDFDDEALDARWQWYTPYSAPQGAPAYVIEDGLFTMSIPGGDYDSWAGFDRAPRLRTQTFAAGEDFMIETRMMVEIPVFADYFHTGLIVEYQDALGGPIDGWFYGFYSRPTWAGNHTIRVERVGHRSPASPDNFPVPWSYAEADLKIERIGDMYTFFYREYDGLPWEVLHSTNVPDAAVTHVGLFMKNWANQIPVQAAFERFVLDNPEGAAPVLGTPPDATALVALDHCVRVPLLEGFPLPAWTVQMTPAPAAAPQISPDGLVTWRPAAADSGKVFTIEATAANLLDSASVSWQTTAVDTFRDDFEDGDFIAGLEFHTPQTGPIIDLDGGVATLRLNALGDQGLNFDTWAGFDRMPRLHAALPTCGDFVVETSVAVLEPAGLGNLLHGGLWVSFNTASYAGLIWGPYGGGQELRLEQMGTNMPQTALQIPGIAVCGLRMERRGDAMRFLYRTDPEEPWVHHWTLAIPGAEIDFIGLCCKNYGGGIPVTMQFDYLRIAVPVAEAPHLSDPCPASVNVTFAGDAFIKQFTYVPGTPDATAVTVDGPGEFDPSTGRYHAVPGAAGEFPVTITAHMPGTDPVSVSFVLTVNAARAFLEEFEVDEVLDLDPHWELYNPQFLSPPPFEIAGEIGARALRFTVEAPLQHDHWTFVDNAPQVRINAFDMPQLAGDFTIETEVNLAAFNTQGIAENFQAGITVGFGTLNIFYWGFFQGTGLRLERSGAQNLHTAPNTATRVKLRISRRCDQYVFFYKPDGGQWTFATSAAVPDDWNQSPTFVGMIVKTWGAAATAVIDFEYFDVFGTTSAGPVLEDFCPGGASFVRPGDLFTRAFTYRAGYPGATTITVSGPGDFDSRTGVYSLIAAAEGPVPVQITAETEGFAPVSASFEVCVLSRPIYEEFNAATIDDLARPWDAYNPGMIMPAPFELDAGALIVSVPAGTAYDHWDTVNRAPQLRLHAAMEPALRGDFTLQTDVALLDYLPGAPFHSGVAVGFGEYSLVYFGFLNGTDVGLEQSGRGGLSYAANASPMVTLRVRRECDSLYFAFRPEAGDWVDMGRLAFPWPEAPDLLWVGTITKTFWAGAAVTTVYENVDILQSDTCTSGEAIFLRGDVNVDGALNIADAIYVLSHLFGGGPGFACPDAADANDDGVINIADAITLLSHLFAGAGPLPMPFGACGPDPTPDALPPCSYDPHKCP